MTEKKTPAAWCDQYGLDVLDPDGWRRDHAPWAEPVTLPEFWRRFTASTVRQLSYTEYDRVLADIQAAESEAGRATTDTTGRRVRIETTLGRHGRPHPQHTSVHIDDEEITDSVASIQLDLNANAAHEAQLLINRTDEPPIGNGAPFRHANIQPLFAAELAAAAEPLQCLACLIDRHNGIREDVRPAMVILNGASVCAGHFKIQDGPAPLPDRTPNGIILGQGH
jgi:hypothetical protein